MFVFIDPTEFVNDPYAEKMSWDWLRDWKDCDFARVVVPQIVIEEITKQYRFSLKDVGRKLNRCLLRISKLLPKGDWSFPPIPTDGAEDEYRKAITQRLAELRIEQPDHSGIVLVTCAGGSTEAAIASQMIVDYLAQTNDSAAIISESVRDFGAPGKPADDLLADLDKRGISRERIRIYRNLFDFVKAHVEPRLKKRDDLIEAIENGTCPFDSDQLFADRYDEIFESLSNFIEPWGEFPSNFNTPDFGSPRLAELSTVPAHFQIDSLDMNGSQFILFVRYRPLAFLHPQHALGAQPGHRPFRLVRLAQGHQQPSHVAALQRVVNVVENDCLVPNPEELLLQLERRQSGRVDVLVAFGVELGLERRRLPVARITDQE